MAGSDSQITELGYRLNVCIVIANAAGLVLWAKRFGRENLYQFPQGGIKRGESAETAMFRELQEEVGLKYTQVEILGSTKEWYRYNIPERYKKADGIDYIGQQQKWFLLRLLDTDVAIDLNSTDETPEFDAWSWVSYWYPLNQVVEFKRSVYQQAMLDLAPSLAIEEH